MSKQIRVAAVSYLNTKPLLYGLERSSHLPQMELLLDYPANLARDLRAGKTDLALLPVAAIPEIENARIVSNYGIAADGEVASVAIFSEAPMEEIRVLYLDYQSRTSVALAQLMLREYWKQEVTVLPAPEDYIERLAGATAGVIIGDRALEQLKHFPYVYDLAAAWKAWTGLPFVFAAWVSNKDLPEAFLTAFDAANAAGLQHLDEVVKASHFPAYDLRRYYTQNIHYRIDAQKRKGLEHFLDLLQKRP